MIKLLIVDDHAIVRKGLADVFHQDGEIEIVGLAENGEEGIRLASELRPDVVIMDISMPGIGGIEAAKQLVAQNEGVRVVMLTSSSERHLVVSALSAGAVGYLLKDSTTEELVSAVKSAADGNAPFSPKASLALLPNRKQSPKLTHREIEVLRLVVEGLSNKQIARRLEISEKTVKAHLTSAFSSIGVSDRTQAALWVERQGSAVFNQKTD